MTIGTTREKFLHELGDLYDAENRFLKGQQELLQAATDETLKGGIARHIAESEEQVKNLEQVFAALGEQAKAAPCDAAQGIVKEAQKNLKEARTPELRDCLIGSSAMKVEHYEIVSYQGLILGAEQLGQPEAVDLLKKNLQQEEQTAQQLEKHAPKLLKKALQAEKA